MDKKREYYRIGKDAGIQSPDVEYNRKMKTYEICISLPNSVINPRNTVGFVRMTVGAYTSYDEAREKIADDLRDFIMRYPIALDKVSKPLADRIRAEHAFTIGYEGVTEDNVETLLTALLEQIINSYALTLPITKAHRETAEQGLKYIQDLKAKLPQNRQLPVYEFEVDCPYCGRHVTLERHSPHEPQHCGAEECSRQHERILARERKRRQRKRNKSQ